MPIGNEVRINTSVSFDPDLIRRLDMLRGRMSRSSFINIVLDSALTEEEKKLGLRL